MASFTEHLSQLDSVFAAKDIMGTPLLSIDEGKEFKTIVEEAKCRNIDTLGYRKEGRIIGVIERTYLEKGSPPKDGLSYLTEDILVSANTSLSEVFRLLKVRKFLLVNKSNTIVGTVTSQDLDKRPVRLLLFSAIVEFERIFIEYIRRLYEGNPDGLQDRLNDRDWKEVESLYEEKRKANEDISHFDCLNPGQILKIISVEPKLREVLGLSSKSKVRKIWGFLPTLRAQVVHPTDNYTKAFATTIFEKWEMLIAALQELERKKVQGSTDVTFDKRSNP